MLMLEAKLPGMIVATLHSNQLRNSEALLNGFFEVRGIHQPTLFFLNKDTGTSTKIKLFDGELGKGVFTTPWSRIFKTLPPGTYDLLLKIAGPTPASYHWAAAALAPTRWKPPHLNESQGLRAQQTSHPTRRRPPPTTGSASYAVGNTPGDR